MSTEKILLVYDQQCPACDYYCQLMRIRNDLGELQLIDAREHGEIMSEITGQGLDIDQGMVLKLDEQLYYGADAIHMLALLGSRSGWFNRVNYWMFKSQTRSRLLYPPLRLLRNLLLKLLGKTKINNLGRAGNIRF